MKKIYIWLLLLLFATPAFADSTINNLGAGSALSGTEQIPMFQGANPAVTTTPSAIKTYIAPVTSVATSCGVSGGPITSTGTIQANVAPNAQTGTTYTLASTDCGKFVTLTNASAIAVTIPVASTSGFGSGYVSTLIDEGAGTATLTPTTSTIDGAASLTLTTGQSVDLYSDGTNYFTARGKASGGTVTTTGTPASGNLSKFSGTTAITNGDLSGDCTTSGTLTANCGLYVPNYQASSWYLVNGPNAAATGSANSLNRIGCAPINFRTKLTLGAIGAHIQTVGTTNIQIALYTQGTDGLPNTQIAATASIVDTALGAVSGAISAQVGPGSANGQNLFACFNAGDNTVAFTAISASDPSAGFFLGTTTAAALWNSNTSALLASGISCAGANCNGASSTFGTWPASLHGSTWTYDTTAVTGVFFPLLMFQVASVP